MTRTMQAHCCKGLQYHCGLGAPRELRARHPGSEVQLPWLRQRLPQAFLNSPKKHPEGGLVTIAPNFGLLIEERSGLVFLNCLIKPSHSRRHVILGRRPQRENLNRRPHIHCPP